MENTKEIQLYYCINTYSIIRIIVLIRIMYCRSLLCSSLYMPIADANMHGLREVGHRGQSRRELLLLWGRGAGGSTPKGSLDTQTSTYVCCVHNRVGIRRHQ